MIAISAAPVKVSVRAAVTLAGLLAASCAPQYSPPQQVAASNPTVTYKYHGDQDLLQANQQAVAFCSQYQAAPRTAGLSSDPDGSRVVVFECAQTPPPVIARQPFVPDLSYSYRTDQELLDASRNAQAYCMNGGSQPVVSSIAAGANGTRTVTFQCGRS